MLAPDPRTGDGNVPAASSTSRATHGQEPPIPRSHALPCPAHGSAGAHPRSEVSGVDPGGTLPAGRLAAITHGTGRLRVSAPGAARSTASARAGSGQLPSVPPWRGTVPAPCLGAGPVAGCLFLLPDMHHRSRGRGFQRCHHRGQSCWDGAAAARCISNLMQKKPGVGLIARKTAELQSSRNKSDWKWSGSEDSAAGAAHP